jgi:hypothetical protein
MIAITNPAIAIPDVRTCIGIASIGGGTFAYGMVPVGGGAAARLVPQIAQNAAPGAVALPH